MAPALDWSFAGISGIAGCLRIIPDVGNQSGRFTMRRHLGARLVRLAIVTTVVVVTLAAAHSSIKSTSLLAGPAVRWTSTIRYGEQTCLQASIRRSLPQGAHVYLATPKIRQTPILMFEAVLVAPWADPTTRTAAQWTVSIKPGGKLCRGLAVYVRKI